MSTRSQIAFGDEMLRVSYVHYDGYFGGVGQMLVEFYDNDDAPRLITDLGALSYLERKLYPSGPEHSHGNPEDDVTVAFHRDRGDELYQEAFPSFKSWLDHLRKRGDIEYAYFRRHGKWWGMRVPELHPIDLKARLALGNLPKY